MKKNEVYGVSTAIQQAEQQLQMPDDALMSRNVCYATTQHMEIVDNECYGCVPTPNSQSPGANFVGSTSDSTYTYCYVNSS